MSREDRNERIAPKSSGGGVLIAVVIGGFLLVILVAGVGAVGAFLFWQVRPANPGPGAGAISQAEPTENELREIDVVIGRAQQIQQAIKSFEVKSGGGYPTKIEELVQGESPFLPNPATIFDPWNQKFQFEVKTDAQGAERIFVWTTNPNTGKRIQWPRY